MDIVPYVALLGVIFMNLVTESVSIRCYVCSFSPDDKNNRTDRCTEENFRPEHVYVHDCPLGCEVFVQYDANDVLEHWRRNCVREGQDITGTCKESKAIGWKKIRCTCDADLCNKSTSLSSTGLRNVLIAVTWFLLVSRTVGF